MNHQKTGEKDYTVAYSLLPLFYWGAFCSIVSYASFYLLNIGLTNSVIGMIIAVAAIFSAVLQPLVASYADRADSPSLKKIVLALCGLQLAGYILLFCIHGKTKMVSGVLFAVEIGLQQLITPLMNSLGTETLNQGKKLNYGVARAMGSFGYAIVAYVLGIITSRSGAVSVLLVTAGLLFALEISIIAFPFEKRQNTEKKEKAASGLSSGGFDFFRRYPRFTVVLVGCVLIYISHVLINNFTLQIVQSKGGGSAEMGTAQALASIIELPIMFCFGWMLKLASSRSWFRITGIFFFLKTFFTLLAPNMPVFYGVQIFQMFGWALIVVSSVYYVNEVMQEQDKIKGQAYFTMTYTIGSVFGSFLGGALLEQFSANVMMACGSVCGLIGAVIMFLAA